LKRKAITEKHQQQPSCDRLSGNIRMKKANSLFGALLIAGSCLAQQSNATAVENYTVKKDAFKLQIENVALYSKSKNNKAVVNNSTEKAKPSIANTASQTPALRSEKTNAEGIESKKPLTDN